jgi:hypothetical protein
MLVVDNNAVGIQPISVHPYRQLGGNMQTSKSSMLFSTGFPKLDKNKIL